MIRELPENPRTIGIGCDPGMENIVSIKCVASQELDRSVPDMKLDINGNRRKPFIKEQA